MLIFVVELFHNDAYIKECSADDDRAWGRWQKVTRFRNVASGHPVNKIILTTEANQNVRS
jgi:hypothetical protein